MTARRISPLLIAATLVSLVAGAGLLFAILFAGDLARSRILEEARRRGVELTFEDASFWWWSTSLEGVRFRLVGVPGLEGTAETIDVTLSDWRPTRIVGSDVRLDVAGSAADLAVAVGEWAKNHPEAYRVPVSARPVGVVWRPAAGQAPWLTLEGGSLTEQAPGTTFTATRAAFSGVELGAVTAGWSADAAHVTMAFGAPAGAPAPLTLAVRHAAAPPTATIVLAPTELSRLAGPFGVPLPAPGVVASGQVDLAFTPALERGPVTGRMSILLDGWVPPHPVELDGFVFGRKTTFTSELAIPADHTFVELTSSRVRAGAFELAGGGRIERRADHALLGMDVSGHIPCAAIAESAAAAHVGSFLAAIVGGAARRVVEGSVAVRVRMQADSRNLAAARIDPTIGVGCGLSPLKALDPKLLDQMPKELRDLALALPPPPKLDFGAGKLPPLPTALPTLPSALPPLPAGLPFPFPPPAQPPAPEPKKGDGKVSPRPPPR